MYAKGRRDASPSLLEAQERLIELRKLVRGKEEEPSPRATAHGRSPITQKQPTRQENQETAGPAPREFPPVPSQPTATAFSGDGHLTHAVKLYPDIALALLRQQLVAPGRLWLLLRYIDPSGRGWLEVDQARRMIARKGSSLRAVGWRQMRKLLARGEGLFWRRDGRRIWLRSPIKVAASLGVQRLSLHPVGLPISELLQSIGLVRAHFYASFHSGRAAGDDKQGRAAPIARATLQALCQTSRRTLLAYERRTGVQKQRNFAVGRPLAVADHQNQAWQRGRALFRIDDRHGRAGREGITYTAWQLPNNYQGPHKKQPRGRQKRMNRKLADLFMKGMTGNDELADRGQQANNDGDRRFFDSGAAASTQYNRCSDGDIYWPCRQRPKPAGAGPYQLWHWLPPHEQARFGHDNVGNKALGSPRQ